MTHEFVLIALAAVVLFLPLWLAEKIRSRMKKLVTGDDEKARGRGETFADEKSPPTEPVTTFITGSCPPVPSSLPTSLSVKRVKNGKKEARN